MAKNIAPDARDMIMKLRWAFIEERYLRFFGLIDKDGNMVKGTENKDDEN